jgi:hypothetical protein
MALNRKVQISTRRAYSLQNGTIPTGVTSAGAKYPINSADVSIDNPNDYYGPTQTPLVSPLSLTSDFKINLDGNWTGRIKTGDPVQIQRGNILSDYVVQNLLFNPGTTSSEVTLNNRREVVHLLDPYIGASGYTSSSYDTYLDLTRTVESPNSPDFSLVKSFSVRMTADSNPDTFSLSTEWMVDPSVKTTRIRWRSVPRNSNVSNLSFSIATVGNYSQVPLASVISTTGRKAEIQLTSTILAVAVATGGTGYTSLSAVLVSGGGTGATLSTSISSGALSSVSVVSGGTGYSSLPSVVITGDGTGASAYVSQVQVTGVYVIQQGGNYLSAPTVNVDPTYQTGITAAAVSSALFLQNSGRVDYLRVTDGGTGYTGATIGITGSSYLDNATAYAEILNGSIYNIVLTSSGHGYNGATAQPVITITPTGTGGIGASAVANVDIYSSWVYEEASSANQFSKTLSGFKYNIPYEIEILASQDEHFRGLIRYTNTTYFQYYK